MLAADLRGVADITCRGSRRGSFADDELGFAAHESAECRGLSLDRAADRADRRRARSTTILTFFAVTVRDQRPHSRPSIISAHRRA